MKKTIQINIAGTSFYMDEDAYEVYTRYIDSLKEHYKKQEGSQEILEDIEARIAEIFRSYLSENKQAISLEDVNKMMDTLGRVEDIEEPGEEASDASEEKPRYKLFRDREHSFLGGVCSGLGAYFNVDPIVFRLLFIALVFANGLGFIAYVILWIVVPPARTASERMQMRGEPVNLSGFSKNINEEYAKVKSNFRNFRESKNYSRLRDGIESLALAVVNLLKFAFKAVGGILLFALIIGSAILIFWLIGSLTFNWDFHWFDFHHHFYGFREWLHSSDKAEIIVILVLFIILIPLAGLIIGFMRLLLNARSKNHVLRAFATTAWVLAVIFLIFLLLTQQDHFTGNGMRQTSTYPLRLQEGKTLIVSANTLEEEFEGMTVYSFFGLDFYYNKYEEEIMGTPSLEILSTTENSPRLEVTYRAKMIFDQDNWEELLNDLEYEWNMLDTILYLDGFYSVEAEEKWKLPAVSVNLYLPVGTRVLLKQETYEILQPYQRNGNKHNDVLYKMDTSGLDRISMYAKTYK